MKKTIKIAIVSLILFLTFGIFTNPSKEDFVEWGQSNMKNNSKNLIEYSAVSVLGKPYLTTKTKVNNYFIFSVFNTNLKSDTESVKTLGAFNKFFTLSSPK